MSAKIFDLAEKTRLQSADTPAKRRATTTPDRGEVAEWSNAAVSKTVVGVSRPRVRIPVSPPLYQVVVQGKPIFIK